MSSTTLKVGALVTVLLAVILIVLAWRVANQYAVRAEQAAAAQQAPVQQKLAVVAIEPLAALQPIQPGSVALVPVHTPPANYFATVEEVIGRSPLVDIDTGAPVTPRYFADGNVLAHQIPDGHKAISVEIDNVIAVGGFVRPGDVVDVLIYVRGGAQLGSPQARTLIEGLRVLAFDERIIDRPEGLEETQAATNRRRRQQTAVLAVPDRDATRFVLGANLGELTLAMHGQAEAESDARVAGLPQSDAARKRERDRQVPDGVVTAEQLLQVRKPPAEQKKKPPPKPKVTVHRGSDVEEVRP